MVVVCGVLLDPGVLFEDDPVLGVLNDPGVLEVLLRLGVSMEGRLEEIEVEVSLPPLLKNYKSMYKSITVDLMRNVIVDD